MGKWTERAKGGPAGRVRPYADVCAYAMFCAVDEGTRCFLHDAYRMGAGGHGYEQCIHREGVAELLLVNVAKNLRSGNVLMSLTTYAHWRRVSETFDQG